MDSSASLTLGANTNFQPTIEIPIDICKDAIAEPATKVEQVLSSRMQVAIAHEDEDDDCVICYTMLYRPVKTACGHSACEACMLHWALAAMDDCNDQTQLPSNLTVDGINFRCPTCRTYTTATFDAEQEEKLRIRHPTEYAARAEEHAQPQDHLQDESATRTMLVMCGNSHRKVDPTPSPYTGAMRHHEWTFFVKLSQPELIEVVKVVLHPSFRDGRLVTLREPPFSTTHVGDSYFTIFAGVQLKKGYEWVDEDRAVDSSSDCKKDILPVEWLLDFRGNGSQNNRLAKFRKVQDEPEKTNDGEVDLSVLAEFMSESEIEQLREVRRSRLAARRLQEDLERNED